MHYVLTRHAKERMVERNITEALIEEALHNPTRVLYDARNRLQIRKLYIKTGQHRILLIFGEVTGESLKIITIIDTSKIRKYL